MPKPSSSPTAAGIAIAAALALTGCERQEPAPAPGETPPLATADPAPTPGAAAPVAVTVAIPARYHGVWDAVSGTCDPASDMRVQIGPQRIEYYESVGNLTAIADDGEGATAQLAMTGEGQSWTISTRLTILDTPEGERLRLSDAEAPDASGTLLRRRCPN